MAITSFSLSLKINFRLIATPHALAYSFQLPLYPFESIFHTHVNVSSLLTFLKLEIVNEQCLTQRVSGTYDFSRYCLIIFRDSFKSRINRYGLLMTLKGKRCRNLLKSCLYSSVIREGLVEILL